MNGIARIRSSDWATKSGEHIAFAVKTLCGAAPELRSYLRHQVRDFMRSLTADRLVLTADVASGYPSESLMAFEDVAGTLPMLRCAEIVSTNVAGIGVADIDVSADRLSFDVGDICADAGDRIEGRLPGMGWLSAGDLPRAMGEAGR